MRTVHWFKTRFIYGLVALLFGLLVSCGTADDNPDDPNLPAPSDLTEHTRSYFDYFGTHIVVRIWGDDALDHTKIFTEIDALLRHVHTHATRYDPFPDTVNVHTINAQPDTWHTVDPMLIDMVELGQNYYNHPLGNQVFNITLGKVLDVWADYRDRCLATRLDPVPDCEVPSLETLQDAAGDMTELNPSAIELDRENNRLRIPEGLGLDLGGIAKGYGAREVGRYLRTTDVSHFMVNAGASNIEFYGAHPSGTRDYWTVGTRDPFNPLSTYAQLKLYSGQNSVTSGDYERFFTVDGVNYHHIIDPATLYPSMHIRATTIVGPDPLLADIYSTLVFVLPIEEGIAFIDALDDYEAIWMLADRTVRFSENFEAQHLNELRIENTRDDATPLLMSLLGFAVFVGLSFLVVTLKNRAQKTTKENPAHP